MAYTRTPEIREKIRQALLGRKHSAERRHNNSIGHTGITVSRLGKKHTEATKRRISEAKKGCTPWNYLEDRSLLKRDNGERGGQLHREWSRSVKNRDGWQCKIANGDCSGRLEAHHILGWKDYPELRYSLNNGIALCHFHHPRRRKEEKRLSSYFMELVSVSKE